MDKKLPVYLVFSFRLQNVTYDTLGNLPPPSKKFVYPLLKPHTLPFDVVNPCVPTLISPFFFLGFVIKPFLLLSLLLLLVFLAHSIII